MECAPPPALDELTAITRVISAACTGIAGTSLHWVAPIPWLRERPAWFTMSEEEVSSLFPQPWSRSGSGTQARLQGPGILAGISDDGTVVRLPVAPAEGRHLLVVGETGMGKSTAIIHLALGAARNAGVVLFDPIGDTAREFLDHLPTSWLSRTLWISPTDSPIPLNALDALRDAARGEVSRERAGADLVGALRRIRLFRHAETAFWGPRLEEMLGRAIAAAARYPRGTLLEAEQLLSGVGGRSVSGVPEETRVEVERLEALARTRPDEVDGARRLLSEVTHQGSLRSLLCQPGATLRSSDLVRPGGLTVISGDAPTVGESAARYLLAVYLALVWNELLARPAGPKTILVLDEAQWYAHEAVGEVLRLGRRSNVHLWLATQALNALSETVKESVLTNASDFLVFRGSPDDAREFSRWRPDLGPEEILALGQGEAFALTGKGREVERVRLSAPRVVGPSDARRRIAARSRALYGVPAMADRVNEPAPSGAAIFSVDLLEVIAAAFLAAPDSTTVTIPLSYLRRELDEGGLRVRELGSRLARAGALRERRRADPGQTWVVGRPEVEAMRGIVSGENVAAVARDAWERVLHRAAERGQFF
ncbi:MAG: DUF87 domain-containing protein [Thermoplasmata archaeon]|nr:DUF87 domain-containing protein [Thermoplasmata archaeon]